MIMNHTIDIEEMPVKKDFVRGVSYLTGKWRLVTMILHRGKSHIS